MKKKSLHVDLPVVGDAGELIDKLIRKLEERGCTKENTWFSHSATASGWLEKCSGWKKNYPVVTEKHYQEMEPGRTNIYAFYQQLSKILPEGAQILVSVGTSRVAGSQAIFLKKGQRFYTNAVTASMGYGLPAAIGVCIASGGKEVICVTGEGSLQMNIQELQTIRHHQIPIRIFVINNEGYHSIRQTQNSYFKGNLVGVGEDLALVQAAFDVVALGLLGKEHGDAVLLRADGRKRDAAGLRRQNDSDLAGVEILGELVRNVLEQTGVDAVVEETVDLDDVAGQDSALAADALLKKLHGITPPEKIISDEIFRLKW